MFFDRNVKRTDTEITHEAKKEANEIVLLNDLTAVTRDGQSGRAIGRGRRAPLVFELGTTQKERKI